MLGKVYAALTSLKFTAALIFALAVLSLVGITVPQKAMLGREAYLAWQEGHPTLVAVMEALQLTELHSSVLMVSLWVLFFLNLVLVMAGRIPGIWRLCREVRLPREAGFVRGYRCVEELAGVSLDSLGPSLEKSGYRVIREGSALAAIRNRYAPLATLLFHLSFLLLLGGGILTIYTKFRAEADVAVGETFSGEYSRILTRPKIGTPPSSTFTVLTVQPTYYNQTIAVDLAVDLQTRQGKKQISINRPYYDGSLSFLIRNIDVAPLFVVRDASGREIDGVFVKLKILNGKEDSFKLQGDTFHTRFHTDIVAEQRQTGPAPANLPQALKQTPEDADAKSAREIVNPAITLTLERDGQRRPPLTLRLHEALPLDNGLRLVWEDYTYWINFYVGYERGLWVVYGAFVLMTIALIIRFGFYRRDIRAFAEGDTLHVGGRSEYFPALFADEFATLMARVRTQSPPSSSPDPSLPA